jgi:hypothetical protein
MTKLGYVVDEFQEFMRISLNQSYIPYAPHRDSLLLAKTIYDVKTFIRMEREQPVIIKFFCSNGHDPRQIVEKPEAQFHEDAYSLRTVQF